MSISEFFKKLFSRMVITNGIALIIVTMVIGLGTLFFLDIYTNHGKEVTMPDICNTTQEVAQKKLEAIGLRMEVTDTGYVYNAAPYTVLEQSIAAGKKIKPGRIIHVTINANGPRQIAIPDVADNCSRREAEDKLRILGFKLGATEYVTGDPEWVLGVKVNGKNVPAGTKVSVNTPITLVVGKGGLDDIYNGNDSLDYYLNPPEPEEDIIEGETEDGTPQPEPTHEDNFE